MSRAPHPFPLMVSADHIREVRCLSDRLVALARPLRLLQAVRWSDEVERQFFAARCQELPVVSRDTYQSRALSFDPEVQDALLSALEREIHIRLGDHPAGCLLRHRTQQCRGIIAVLRARGTAEFAPLSRRLYLGEHPLPCLASLAGWLRHRATKAPVEERTLDANQAADLLARRLEAHFADGQPVHVAVRRHLSADAVAAGNGLKLRWECCFGPRELQLLEAHEGWVHLGTTRNGRQQPVCTFLGQTFPACTPTQEGLAVLAELLCGEACSVRLQRLALRIEVVTLAEHGADFLDVFRYLREQGQSDPDSYRLAARVFRGSLPVGAGPFAKDLAYGVGLLQVARFLRGRSARERRLLWCGKVALADMRYLAPLAEVGLVWIPASAPMQVAC